MSVSLQSFPFVLLWIHCMAYNANDTMEKQKEKEKKIIQKTCLSCQQNYRVSLLLDMKVNI